MKTRLNLIRWTLSVASVFAALSLLHGAEALIDYKAQSRGSKVSIDGTSTIHDWTVVGTIIGGSFKVEPAFKTDKSLASVLSLTTKEKNPVATVKIPIRSLKSGKDSMDRIMQEAMGAKEHRMIKYKLTRMVVKGDVPESGTPVKFDTTGELVISGVTRKVDIEVTMERLADGKIKFSGSEPLKMTDFKITPPAPKLALGMIKTGDDVTVKFEWVVGERKRR